MRPLLAALVVCTLCLAPAGHAEIYRWTGADGREHFTTELSRVPPEYRDAAVNRAKQSEQSGSIQYISPGKAATPRKSTRTRASAARAGSQKTYRIQVTRAGSAMGVMVQLNDRVMVPFYIDTGASDVVIPRAFARKAGFVQRPGTRTKVYSTANGIIEQPVFTLDSVDLGGARAENVQASVSDSMSVGLLGLSYFNNFTYRIDPAQGIVELTPNGMTEQGLMKAGRSENQWRLEFASLRRRLEQIETQIKQTPSLSTKQKGLERQRDSLEQQYEDLKLEADRAHVPHSWRD